MLGRVEWAFPKFRVKFRGQKLKLKLEDMVCSEAPGCLGTPAKTGVLQPQGLVASGTKDKSLAHAMWGFYDRPLHHPVP